MKPINIKKALLSLVLVILSALNTYAQQSLWVGQSYTFDVSSSVMGITANMSWSTSGGYLSLSGSGFYRTITVTQYFSGTATVTCEWDYKLTGNGSYTHTKRQVTISCQDNQVSISPASLTMSPGESRYVSYRHQYDNQYTSNANAYFQSSDPSICTVSPSGEVIAMNPGTTYINVYSKISSVSPYCKVTVRQVEPTSVSLPSSITITAGETRSIYPTIYPLNAQTSYSWSSSDSQIVSVSSSGTITANKHGSAIITVKTSNGLSASSTVSVQKRKLILTSSHKSGLIEKGSNIMLTSDVSDAKIYFTTNNSSPTANSSLYSNPISVNNSTCIKAVAIHPDYLDSDVMVIDLTTTSLSIISTTPDPSMSKAAPHLIPCIEYNSPIKEDVNFNSIKCTSHQENIEFTTIIDGAKLYIIPKEDLNGKSISIFLNAETVQNMYGEPNMELSLHLDYEDAFLKEIKKFGSHYYLCENGDWYIWGLPSDFPISLCRPEAYQHTPIIALKNIKDVYPNYIRRYYLTYDNTLMGWFLNNTFGDEYILGDGTTIKSKDAVIISSDVKKYVGTVYNNGIIKSDNTLWLWGYNNYGQVGNGYTKSVYSPMQILTDVKDVLVSDYHTLALKNDGSVWGWGQGATLGISSINVKTPVELSNLPNGIVEFKSSDTHNIILTDKGEVFCFGKNTNGQIGIGSYSDFSQGQKVMENVIHIYIESGVSFALKENGDLFRWGRHFTSYGKETSNCSPELIFTNVKNVFVNRLANNTVVLRNDNSVWCLGSNAQGLLSTGTADVFEYSATFVKIFDDVENVWLNDENIYVKKLDGSYWGLGHELGILNNNRGSSYIPIEVLDNKNTDIISISIPEQIIVEKGQKSFLSLQISPISANHKELSWSSDNENIVTVDNGIIVGVSEGEANITVRTNDYQMDHMAQCLVKVVSEGAGLNEIPFSVYKDITVYNISGILLYHGNSFELPYLSSGVYIIKHGEKTIKYFQR